MRVSQASQDPDFDISKGSHQLALECEGEGVLFSSISTRGDIVGICIY